MGRWGCLVAGNRLRYVEFTVFQVSSCQYHMWPYLAFSCWPSLHRHWSHFLWGQTAISAHTHLKSWLRPQKPRYKIYAGFFVHFLFSKTSVCIWVMFSSLSLVKGLETWGKINFSSSSPQLSNNGLNSSVYWGQAHIRHKGMVAGNTNEER